ncbi:MAG: gamma-glutamylcyclotransferase [Thermoplasmata archaeon]|nr:gamma-glutamylcyclotransferase [Thermoplasmata archaeon]
MKHHYFAYGSNLDIEQMKRRCPESELIGPASLEGYKLAFTFYSTGWRGGVADILIDDRNEVWGVVYALTDSDLESLDWYEGCPKSYRRFQASVKMMEGGEKKNVWVYEVLKKKSECLPTKTYLRILMKAAEQNGFPKWYCKTLEKIWLKVLVECGK